MPRHLIQDIKKIKVRSLLPDEEHKTTFQPNIHDEVHDSAHDSIQHSMHDNNKEKIDLSEVFEGEKFNKKKSYRPLWFLAVASVVFLFIALSSLFAKAKITVVPRVEKLTLNDNLLALKNPGSEDLSFRVISFSSEISKKIEGKEDQNVSKKADGLVLVYNAFSSKPQELGANTRLEGSNGKIYRTKKKIIIPGMDQNNVPGSKEVEIYATMVGKEYDSSPIDFKILAFKKNPKYNGFYARSSGKISGGFTGKAVVISNVQKTSVINEIEKELKEILLKKLVDQIPSDHLLFKEAVTYDFIEDDNPEIVSVSEVIDNLISVKVKGTANGFIFNKKNITEKVSKNIIKKYGEVEIKNLQDLTFSFLDKGNISKDVENINFNLSGKPTVVWKFDKVKFANEILGMKKNNFNKMLSQYPNIVSNNLEIFPFWVRFLNTSLPSKIEKIEILVKD
jgi:hypothetical protein